MLRLPQVRICASAAHWLDDDFESAIEMGWSTSEKTRKGDIQIFAISTNLKSVPELKGDKRVDAAHSIWKAVDEKPKRDICADGKERPLAQFKRLIKLETPVPKSDFIDAGLLKRIRRRKRPRWPQHYRGMVIRSVEDIKKLVNVLVGRNPKQKRKIEKILLPCANIPTSPKPQKPQTSGNNRSGSRGAGFGTPEDNKKVEKAAIDCVKQWYKDRGWKVDSREKDGVGYDLECKKRGKEKHVEVKGVKGDYPSFIITAQQVEILKSDPYSELAVVLKALTAPQPIFKKGKEAAENFTFKAIQYVARPKR